MGGEILVTEATLMPGRGRLTLTGKLGDVMQESAQAAMSYIRSRAEEFGIPKDFNRKLDVHVHIPEGAIPKDGPSAGITLATAMISALAKIKTRREVAMTGEITLRGKVLPIGGVKEKVLAAHRAGVTTILMPKDNEKDLADIPKNVLDTMKMHLVSIDGRGAEARARRSAHSAAAVGRCRRGGRRGSRRRHALRGVNRSTAAFVTSVAGPGGFPKEALPEIAMVGRSNVGKSSLINALAGQPLARTSAAPGKTRLANYYRLQRDGEVPFFLVDLPGYGYARGGDRAAAEFEVLADAYLRPGRPPGTLAGTGGLPARRQPAPRPAERSQAWAWLEGQGVEHVVLATKLDKLTRAERQRHLRELEEHHQGPVLPISAVTGEGLDELWKLIAKLLRQPPLPPPPLPNPSRS